MECDQETVVCSTIPYNAEVKHDGKLHTFLIPELRIDKCTACGEECFSSETDSQISKELRVYLCFLQPEDIRAKLAVLGINQTDFAKRIGVAKESVSRWLTGATIQNRAMDNLMRLFLGMESVRSVLSENGPREGLGVIENDIVTTRIAVSTAQLQWVSTRDFSQGTFKRRDTFSLIGPSVTHNVR
jgi:DNA-binding transcriptional regulator YiaG